MEKENQKIDQKDINAAAWAACDTFRGVVDPAQYKDYILVILFLRYISDVWQDHYDTYKKEYGDDDERIRRKLERERFVLPVIKLTEEVDGKRKEVDSFNANFYSLYDRKDRNNIGELINITLEHIEEANRTKLAGVFRNIDFNSEANLGKTKDRNRRLKQLLEDFNSPKLDMRPSRVSEDIIGNTYIYLIEHFASDSGKKAGEFFSPLMVTELVARLAQPKDGDTICDPTCGSGSLLLRVARECEVGDFYGQELNQTTYNMARMNMILHGVKYTDFDIKQGDTLEQPQHMDKKFEAIVANPPFSAKWSSDKSFLDDERFSAYGKLAPKSKADYAFLQHMIYHLDENGTMGIVLPHGVLFRGSAESTIREYLLWEKNYLDAVIGLPANIFYGTSIPTCILIFKKCREQNQDVLFIDASKDFEKVKNQNKLRPEDIEKIVNTYANREEIDKYSHKATIEEIKENDFNLNIPRYVDTFEEEEPIDLDEVCDELEKIAIEMEDVDKEIKKYCDELGIRAPIF